MSVLLFWLGVDKFHPAIRFCFPFNFLVGFILLFFDCFILKNSRFDINKYSPARERRSNGHQQHLLRRHRANNQTETI